MKQTIIIIIALFLIPVLTVNAQWKIESVDKGNSNVKLIQINETDSSILIYATLNINCNERKSACLDRTGHIKINGEKYKLKNSINIPMYDEADSKYIYLAEGNNEINYMMEFEKFPVINGFDIIDDGKDGELSFNFYGVTVNKIDSAELINTKRFLESSAPTIYGFYNQNGEKYAYYLRDGVYVRFSAQLFPGGWLGENELFLVDIINGSDHGIMFDFDKVYVTAIKVNRDGSLKKTPLKKYTPDSYDQHISEIDYNNARNTAGGTLISVDKQLDRAKYSSSYDSWERIGWEFLQSFNRSIIDQKTDEYMKEHPIERPKALKSQSINSGESIHGYIATQKKNVDKIVLTVPMDGFNFEASVSVK